MDLIAPVGARTQWEVGGPPPAGAVEVRAPAGVVEYEPADMTVTVGAGTRFCDLDAVLAEHGQEVPLDPRASDATIGGILACGLSGIRRLRHGPVRDHVLQVKIKTGYGRVIKGGGPTVKNVTGYDIPRLFVGSMGTLGLLGEATLRCRPRAQSSRWFATDGRNFFRPAARLWDGRSELVLLEGFEIDVAAQSEGLERVDAPVLPEGPHRGRISVVPARVRACAAALGPDVRWCAELGVGTIHVAADTPDAFVRARDVAHSHSGWMLREEGGPPGDDGYGRPVPNVTLMQRIRDAFDPDHICNPGRLPLGPSGPSERAS